MPTFNKIAATAAILGCFCAVAHGDGIGGGIGGANGIGSGVGDPSGIASEKINLTPTVGCTNQLVMVFSNSCALIGQAWGQ